MGVQQRSRAVWRPWALLLALALICVLALTERSPLDVAAQGPDVISWTAPTESVVEPDDAFVFLHRQGGGLGDMQVTVRVDYLTADAGDLAPDDGEQFTFTFLDDYCVGFPCDIAVDFGPQLGSGIATNNDADEANETVLLTIISITSLEEQGAASAIGAQHEATLTIVDDDGPATYSFSQDEYTFAEAAGTVSITVIRAGDLSAEVGVTCRIAAGTPGAAAGSGDVSGDLPLSDELTFGPGVTSQQCAFTLTNDGSAEATESLDLSFVDPVGDVEAGAIPTAAAFITDDDGPGTFSFAETAFSVVEGAAGELLVTREGGAEGSVTVECTRTGGTATAPPAADADFTVLTAMAVFSNGETSETCYVPTLQDPTMEAGETVTWSLAIVSGEGFVGFPSTTTLTVGDDDGLGSMRFASMTYSVGEADGAALITVERTGSMTGGVSVHYATVAGGTAVPGVDYTGVSGTVYFAPGDTAETFEVPVLNNTANVGPRTVNLELSSPSANAGLDSPTASVLTINEDDVSVPTVDVLRPNAGPVAGGIEVTVLGTGFTGVSSVLFGGAAGTNVVVESPGELRVTLPAGSVGVVDVRVVNAAGASLDTAADDFTYSVGPIVTLVEPDEGPAVTTNFVDLTGVNFTDATNVTFGGVEADFVVKDDTHIVAATPDTVGPGEVDVRVTAPGDTSPVSTAAKFTFTGPGGPPTITGLDPASAMVGESGVEVTITGANFAEPATVTFGGSAATDVEVVDTTTISVTAPVGEAPGFVEVVVTTSAGPSTSIAGANTFAYRPPPGTTLTYSLSFRWSFYVWAGADGMDVVEALTGVEAPDNPQTNNVLSNFTAIYTWSADSSGCPQGDTDGCYLAFFPAGVGIPGANNFDTLGYGVAYWFATLDAPELEWTVLAGP